MTTPPPGEQPEGSGSKQLPSPSVYEKLHTFNKGVPALQKRLKQLKRLSGGASEEEERGRDKQSKKSKTKR